MKMILFVVIFISSFQQSFACSIYVNELHQKNDLISHVASNFNIALTKVNKMQVSNYANSLLGNDPATLCPLELEVIANVTINYKPSFFQECELSVEVTKNEPIMNPGPANYSYNFPASSCKLVRPKIVLQKILKK